MSINSGKVSQNVYVRSNDNGIPDNPNTSGTNNAYFYPSVSASNGAIKFISNKYVGNSSGSPSYGGSDDSYSSGFVTLADAGAGIKVTATGHAASNSAMNTPAFNSVQIWYRYTSSTGPHGTIQTTSEGNYGATLTDGGTVLGPGAYVITEGKTVSYTMTPETGYKLSKLSLNGTEVKFNGEAVSKMKKGDSLTVTTAAGKTATLQYKDDGTYSLVLPHALADEDIAVTWEATTADLYVSKEWKDNDDADRLRKNASSMPKVKLQRSVDGGTTWQNVTGISEQPVPTGQDTQSSYKDGIYYIQNGTSNHPYTWEYLPVYTYDDSGKVSRSILYKLVEDPDPGLPLYKKAQYSRDSFDLVNADTKDKALKYQTVSVKNEHVPQTVYVEVTKKWDDKDIKEKTPAGKNNYTRPDVTFTLSAKNSANEDVDLNGAAYGKDLTLTIAATESDADDSTDGTYKVDDYNYKAVFKNLPTIYNAKAVTYTVTENTLDGWTTTQTELTDVYDSSGNLVGYQKSFTNTPVVDEDNNPVSFRITKTDSNTNEALSGAEFSVYTDSGCTTKASQNSATGKGKVVSNTVTTNESGGADVTFNEAGKYWIKESKAPVGYKDNNTVYEFKINPELNKIELKDVDAGHSSKWWQILFDLIFGTNSDASKGWDKETKSLLVKDEPLTAGVLVSKIWADNNNQDAKRPTDTANLPEVTLQWTTAENPEAAQDSDWTDMIIPASAGSGEGTTASVRVSYNGGYISSDNSAYTWNDLPAFRGGKLVSYRLKETGTVISDGTYADTYDKATFSLATVSADGSSATKRDQTVQVTNTHDPQKITINAQKIWDDNSNQDNKRPGSVTISLYKSVNGIESRIADLPLDGTADEGDAKNKETAPTDNNTWNAVFTDLPAYENGSPVTYRLGETVPSKYTDRYSVSYTKTDGSSGDASDTASVNSSEIKRTYDDNKKETTSATIRVNNVQLLDITATKYWIKGANANVRFQLYRTTVAQTDSSQTAIKEVQSSIDTGKTIKTWSPYGSGSELIEGWKPVSGASHLFVSSVFTYEDAAPGDEESYVFENLPKYDLNGKEYIYRVYETNSSGSATDTRYEADYSSDGLSVANTNKYVSDGTANINVIKVLEGRNWNNSDAFYFKIEPIKGVDNTGKAVDFTESEAGDKAQVPLPYNGSAFTQIGTATNNNTSASARGRLVSFAPISIPASSIQQGESKTYYYKIYEVKTGGANAQPVEQKDDKGITYAAQDPDASVWRAKTSIVRVVATNTGGRVSTSISWDPLPSGSGLVWKNDTPTFVNSYDASAKINAHIIKHIDGREFSSGDSFSFYFSNLPGSIVRTSENGNAITEPEGDTTATITYNTKQKVVPSGSGNIFVPAPAGEAAAGGAYRATKSDLDGYFKVGDLAHETADGKATDTFIYEIYERPYSSAKDPSTAANDKYLILDSRRVYMKVVVTDNQDGTLNLDKSYWHDAACSEEPMTTQLLVYKNDVQDGTTTIPAGTVAPAGASATDDKYEYTPAAFFENTATIDIPVVKEWKNGPAVEDVTLRLQRHLFDLSEEGSLTDDYVKTKEAAWNTDTAKEDFWLNVGSVYNVDRGEFLTDEGTPKYDQESTDTSSLRIEGKSHFNKNLPVYVTEGGTKYRAVYRLVEDDTSDAYETTYRSVQPDDAQTVKPGDNIFIDSGTMYVTNTVTATNVANVAAVKQLQGRQWIDSDDFSFTLEPIGRAVYDDEDHIIGDTFDETMPMPKTDTGRHSETSGEGSGRIATTHAFKGNQTVDPNGGLERLARFGSIEFKVSDLVYDHTDRHMQGDFFYRMKEKLPDIVKTEGGNQSYPVAYTYSYEDNRETKTKTVEITDKALPTLSDDKTLVSVKWNNGLTYDCTEHMVHIKVRENRTSQLQVQVAYDETTQGDISTGTQFTPVFTNTYDAEAAVQVSLEKRIMGREWKSGDNFDFVMMPLAGAPFEDYDVTEFYKNAQTETDAEREAGLKDGKAIHNSDGQHVKRLTVTNASEPVQTLSMPKIKVTFSELNRKTKTDGELKYSNGTTPVPAGTRYGQFMYALEETDEFNKLNENSTDLIEDDDTEYARVTVIDKSDGTLDYYVEMFVDRYAKTRRYVPDAQGEPTSQPAGNAIFVNQFKRDLSVTKAWAGAATSDVTLRLQWSVDEGDNKNWYNVDGTNWLAGIDGTKTISKNAEGNALTVTWKNLPAYANISRNDDKTGTTSDDKELNDKWIYYNVIELPVDNVDIRYNKSAYNSGDTINTKESDGTTSKYATESFHTGNEKGTDGKYVDPADRVNTLYVTNFPQDIRGEVGFGVVKQYIGSDWDDEVFSFIAEPVKSKLGGATEYTDYNETNNKMPAFNTDVVNAQKDSSKVSVNERVAYFGPLVIKRSDLGYDASSRKMKGEFVYRIREIVPNGAVKVTKGSGDSARTVYYSEDSDGKWIRYTGDTHLVNIAAVDDGNSIDATVTFDGRDAGQFVPVFTNYSMVKVPLGGTKTWVGGDDSEHVNGLVTLDDNDNITAATDSLGLKLYRKLDSQETATEVEKDEAGRDLIAVWVSEKRTSTVTGYARIDDPAEVISIEAYTALDDTEKAAYQEVRTASIERTANEKGNGSYVIKAKDGNDFVDPILNSVDENGNRYTYSIAESSVPSGYTAKTSGMNVINTFSKNDSIRVSKTWDDDNDAEGLRPDQINVHLYKEVTVEGGEGSQTKKIQVEVHHHEIEKQEGDVYPTVTWDDLPVYDSDGKKIKYIVEEEAVSGYTSTYSPDNKAHYYEKGSEQIKIELDGDTSTKQTIDIKNSLTPATDNLKVTKVWDDGSNVDGKRPDSVSFYVYEYVWDKTSKKYGSASKVDGKTLTLNADNAKSITTGEGDSATTTTDTNTWEGKVTGLARTKNGKTVIYTVKEQTDPVSSDYENAAVTGDQVSGFTVTNKHTPETTTAKITKTWVDKNNVLNTRPKTVTFRLMRTYDGLSTPEQVDRPSDSSKKVVVKLSADDGENDDSDTWSKTIRNLPKYILVDGTSKPITYFWQEVVPKGYTATGIFNSAEIEAVEGDGTSTVAVDNNSTVTNTMVTGELDVTKKWEDSNDHDKLRPSANDFGAKIRLFAGNTEIADFTATTGITKTVSEGAEGRTNEFFVKFTGLPVFDASGNKIIYRIEESEIDSYSIDGTPELTASLSKAQGETAYKGGIGLTNKHTPDTVDVEVTKNWFDKDGYSHVNIDGYKSKLKLYADGDDVTGTYADKLTVTNADTTSSEALSPQFDIKWSGLPKYKAVGSGSSYRLEEIVYKVTEEHITGYAEQPSYNNAGSNDKSNRKKTDAAYNGGAINNVQLVSVDVEKTWDDNDNHDGKRGNVKVTLYRNGVAYDHEKTLSKDTAPEGGTFSVSGNKWIWTKVWTALPYADNNGTPYNYTATETDKPSGFLALSSASIRQILLDSWNEAKDTMTFSVTNHHDDDKLSFSISKIWDDHSDADNLRPETVSYTLYQEYEGQTKNAVTSLPTGASVSGGAFENGKIKQTVNKTDKTQGTVSTVTLTGMPKFAAGGKEISYSVEETAVSGYTTNVTGGQDAGFTVTNTHVPTSVSVKPALKKTIVGRQFRNSTYYSDDDRFTFVITSETPHAPMPAHDHVTISNLLGTTWGFSFDEIRFTGADVSDIEVGHSKTFTYDIKEANGGRTLNELGYDPSVLRYVVTVTKNSDGTLTASGAWQDGKNTFTNSYAGTTDLVIRKVWVDDDADSTVETARPTSVDITVTANTAGDVSALETHGFTKTADNTYIRTIAVSGTADKKIWVNDTLTGLPKYNTDGTLINYSVSESKVPNYKAAEIEKKGNVFIVTNTYDAAEFTGTKIWDDGTGAKAHDNPTELKNRLRLYRTTDPESGTWHEVQDSKLHIHWNSDGHLSTTSYHQSFTITGLLKEDTNGHAYTYKVVENLSDSTEHESYHVTYTNTGNYSGKTDALYNGGTITNRKGDTVEVSGTKEWVGGSASDHKNVDANGADALGIKLYRKVKGAEGEPVEVTTDDNNRPLVVVWNGNDYIFMAKDGNDNVAAKLDAEQTSGNEYVYSIKETNVPAGYHVNYDGFDIINSAAVTIEATKVWAGDEDDTSKRGEVKLTLYQTVNGAKKASTENAHKSISFHNPVTVATGEGHTADMTASWADMPLFIDGHEVTYTVEESGTPDGYTAVVEYGETQTAEGQETTVWTKTIPDNWNYKVRVTNTLGVDSTKMIVEKKWDDSNDQDGIRPDSVTVSLMNGSEKAKDINGDEVADITLNEANNWKDTFENLPKTDDKGNVNKYTVSEAAVDGYEAAYSYSDDKTKAVITNTHGTGKETITATKVWKDEPETIGTSLRTDVVLHLYGMDGDRIVYDAGTKTISKNKAPDGENAGTASWSDVPKRHYQNKDLDWKIVEEPVFGYTGKVSGNKTDGFTVTNSYTGPKAKITVNKEWKDTYYDDYSARPGKVTYELWKKVGDAEAKKVEEKTVNVENDGSASYTWNDLPVTEKVETAADMEGEEAAVTELPVLYTVKEQPIDGDLGYLDPVIEATSTPGVFNAVNIHKTELKNIKVRKVWNDENDHDGLRPDHITVIVNNNKGLDVQKANITADESWTHTFRGLPVTDADGNKVTYEVEEKAVDGYSTVISQDAAGPDEHTDSYTITNTHGNQFITLEATKKWDESDGDKSGRHDVTFHLVKIYDEEGSGARKVLKGETDRTVATGNNHEENLTAVWNHLPTMEKGRRVFYTVEEADVEGYNCTVHDVIDSGRRTSPDEGNEQIFTVEVENAKGVIPPRGDVIYVDPRNPAGHFGSDRMIVSSKRYETTDEAKAAAEGLTDKPADPKHDGVKFTGWALNWDDNDNYVLVATYSDIPKEVIPIVTYIDPQSGDPILVSVKSKDPYSVKVPDAPKHKGLRFLGWIKVKDEAGNTIFVAQYAPKSSSTAGKGKGVGTGDDQNTEFALWIMVLMLSASLLAIYAYQRKRS
jgi:pilin isopeptide linkage protein